MAWDTPILMAPLPRARQTSASSHHCSFSSFPFMFVSSFSFYSLFILQNRVGDTPILMAPLPRARQTSTSSHHCSFSSFPFMFVSSFSFYSLFILHPDFQTGRPHLSRPILYNSAFYPTEEDAIRSAAAGSPVPTLMYPIAPESGNGQTAYSPQPHQCP